MRRLRSLYAHGPAGVHTGLYPLYNLQRQRSGSLSRLVQDRTEGEHDKNDSCGHSAFRSKHYAVKPIIHCCASVRNAANKIK